MDVGSQKLHVEVIPLYIKSWEESLFPDIPKQQREGFLKKGLRSVEELCLAWNNQKAVPELQGGIAKKGAKCSVDLEDKESSQNRRAGRLQRAGRGEEGSGATRSGLVKCFKSEEEKLELNVLGNKEKARHKIFAAIFWIK